MQSIIVISSKGGVAKTLTAVDLAMGLSQQGKVLFLDTDSQNQGSALTWFNDIGADHLDLTNITWDKTTVEQIPEEMEGNQEYDWLIIDTPPQLNDQAIIKAAEKASLVVVPGGHGADLKATTATLNTLKTHTSTTLMAVITDVDPRSLDTAKRAAGQIRALGYNVCKKPIRHYQGLDDARLYGETPFDISGNAAVNHKEDIQMLIDTVRGLI